MEQFACEGTELYLNCGEFNTIRIVDANYGRLDNSMCSVPGSGTPNDNCRFNATCIVMKRSVTFVRGEGWKLSLIHI